MLRREGLRPGNTGCQRCGHVAVTWKLVWVTLLGGSSLGRELVGRPLAPREIHDRGGGGESSQALILEAVKKKKNRQE